MTHARQLAFCSQLTACLPTDTVTQLAELSPPSLPHTALQLALPAQVATQQHCSNCEQSLQLALPTAPQALQLGLPARAEIAAAERAAQRKGGEAGQAGQRIAWHICRERNVRWCMVLTRQD